MRNAGVELAAETHFMVRLQIQKALRGIVLTDFARGMFPGCRTYEDVWITRFSDRFFDMGTLIRVAAGVETGLRDHYMKVMGHNTIGQLRADPAWSRGVFQRIMPWHVSTKDAIALFAGHGIAVKDLPQFPVVQELMLNRHLYAHNLGVLDDQYIEDLQRLDGTDVLGHPDVGAYPARDVYWFEPLKKIPAFIEGARAFLGALT